jgi:hypothetical protein
LNNPDGSAAPGTRHDLDAINAQLRDTAQSWVPRLFPNGRRRGNEWHLANIAGDPPRNSGSCVITLTGEHAGAWIDFDGDQRGGPLSTLEHGTGLSGRALFAHAVELVGAAAPVQNPARPALRPDRDTAKDAEAICRQAMPITGTPAEAYLQRRGLQLRSDADLLFHPDLMHWDTRNR